MIRALGRSGPGRWGGSLILLLALGAISAPLLTPNRAAVPSDPLGAQSRPPATTLWVVALDDGSRLLADRVTVDSDELLVERRGRLDRVPRRRVTNAAEEGVTERVLFPLGTDRLGRDVWARTVYASRTSLTVGILSALLALTLGILIGGSAAMAGGYVDSLLMRAVDGLLAFPGLVLLIVLSALLRPSPWLLILLIGGTGWMGASRLARAEILSLQRRDFVLAARSLGERPSRIFFRHLLPNALTPLLVDTSLRVGNAILVETALSFLGLGIPPDIPSWGGMIAHGRADLATQWWVTTFPGLAIALTVVTFNLLADGLRDALDPRRGTAVLRIN